MIVNKPDRRRTAGPRLGRPGKRLRQGWTLVELVVAMGASTVLLAVCATLLVTLLHGGDSAGTHRAGQFALAQLASQLRADIHAAVEVSAQSPTHKKAPATETPEVPKPTDQSFTCRLADGRRIVYTQQGVRLVRTEYVGQDRRGRQSFMIPAATDVHWQVSTESSPPMAGLTLRRSTPAGDVKRPRLLVEALIGRDLRWNAKPTETDP